MEILVLIGALVVLSVAAARWGADSRDDRAFQHHERAMDAVRGGAMALYWLENCEFECSLPRRAA